MLGAARPLALGILRVDVGMRIFIWRSARQVILNRALEEGYSLLETFDVVDHPIIDDPTYNRLQSLIRASDVSALVVSGNFDRTRVEELAARFSLRVLVVQNGIGVAIKEG